MTGVPEGRHFVAGAWISCCEQGETDCPCTCHPEPPPRADDPEPAS